MIKVIVLCFLSVGAFGFTIPKFLTPCSRRDPICLQKSAQTAFEAILPGNRKFRIPPLFPLVIPLVEILSPELNLTFTKLRVDGLENGTIQSVKFDTDNKIGEVRFHTPQTRFTGDYNINGRLVYLLLNGQDKANITTDDCYVTWTFEYDLVKKNGQEYLKILRHDNTFKVSSATIEFKELYRGSEFLTNEANSILTEEWPTVFNELSLGIKTTIGLVFNMVATAFFDKVPYNKISSP